MDYFGKLSTTLDTGSRLRAPLYPGSSHGIVCVDGGSFAEIVHEGRRSTRQLERNTRPGPQGLPSPSYCWFGTSFTAFVNC
jgi:hypothetical protein